MLVSANASTPSRSAYSGRARKLVLAFDLGTTFSSVSYSVLDPGLIPEVKGVNRYPAQERSGGYSRIPTVILYDKNGAVKACGAEAATGVMQERKEHEGWFEAKLFNLHLHPNAKTISPVDEAIIPLPPNKTAIDVFADFYRYLFQCTKTYFQETHANGAELWESLKVNIDYVVSHPNDWQGAQQASMRRACIEAGLISKRPGDTRRIRFVTEGEAKLHFCVHNGLATEATEGVLIVDARGDTIDLCAYSRVNTNDSKNIEFQEVAPAQRHFMGSNHVSKAARLFLENHLKGSRFIEDIDFMTKSFNQSTKLRFRDESEPSFINFGSPRDRDASLNISMGKLKIPGSTVAKFFEPSVRCIVESAQEQINQSKVPITSLILVGGFASSDWLFSSVMQGLRSKGIDMNVCRPDGHLKKAVSDGAVSFYLDHAATARMSNVSYGTGVSVLFDPSDREHKKRMHKAHLSASGELAIDGYFDRILPKGVQITETREFRRRTFARYLSKALCTEWSAQIWCYSGEVEDPSWFDVDSENYRLLCTITADISSSKNRLLKRKGTKATGVWFEAEFDVILTFGLTELTAQIGWTDRGIERRSPAQIVIEDY